MSSMFAALNLNEEITAQDAEEHTKELQIEEAFKVFQHALGLQKDLNYTAARFAYKRLFAIDVINGKAEGGISPTVRTLRYLAHRNRGMLTFDELKRDSSTLSSESMFTLLDDAIDDLIEALQHTDGDAAVINMLMAVFKLFGNDRLLRYIVEYQLTKDENEEILTHKKNRHQSRELKPYASEHNRILKTLHLPIPGDLGSNNVKIKLPYVDFLKPLKAYVDEQNKELPEERTVFIKLDRVSLRDIGLALGTVTGKNRIKHHKLKDTYLLKDEIITLVQFSIPGHTDKKADIDIPQIESNVIDLSEAEADQEPEQPLQKPQDIQLVGSPIKRSAADDAPQRSSKRVRTQEDTETLFEAVRERSQRFIQAFNSMVADMDVSLSTYDLNTIDKTTTDFLNCLNSWTSRHTESFLQSVNTTTTDASLAELISSSDPYQDVPLANDGDEEKAYKNGLELVQRINHLRLDYPEARMEFLKELLVLRDDGSCLVMDSHMERDLFTLTESFVLDTECEVIEESNLLTTEKEMSLLVSMYEIIVNFWLRKKQQNKSNDGNSKMPQDIQSTISTAEAIIGRWNKKLGTILPPNSLLSLRHEWCMTMFMQCGDANESDFLRMLLNNLIEKMMSFSDKTFIPYMNHDCIPVLSLTSVRNQCDKLDVVSTFEKALHNADSNTEETISLLESMLLPQKTTEVVGTTTMEKFVKDCPLGIKLELWKSLLTAYFSKGDFDKYIATMDRLLPFLYGVISDDEYHCKAESVRHRTILVALGFYGLYIEGLSNMIKDNRWRIEVVGHALLEHLLKFMSVLYCYCLYEHMGHSTRSPGLKPPTPSKSVAKLRDMIADTFVVIVVLFTEQPIHSSEQTLDLLSIIHEEIGMLHFCDAASGRFLDFSEHLLEGSDLNKFSVDVLQHMNCRFHISISTEQFTPFNHETRKAHFTRDTALKFSDFLFDLLAKKKDPLISQLKPDLKGAMDTFYDAIGAPDEKNVTIQRNTAELDRFLSQALDMRLLRDAFWGSIQLSLKVANVPSTVVAEKGLYYYQGAASMNFYKVRKRLSQGKASDLEQVIKLLTADVVSGTARVETWLLLGEAFALQAEDDIIWTSDRLNSVDKKFAVSAIQKKALLCYCMSLSSYVKGPPDPVVGAMLFGIMSRELYHSLMRPMEGFCFFGVLERKVLTSQGLTRKKSSVPTEKHTFLLKLVLRLLKMAIACDGSSGLNYFYLSKTLHKLHESPNKIINASLKACELSASAVEPHYQLCTMVYKYVKDHGYPEAKAIFKLKRAAMFAEITPIEDVSDEISGFVLAALKKLMSVDKKKWHHRPRFRVAKILYALGEYKSAGEEMENFISLKSSNKTVISIWKPESEVPGKHFVYAYDYICFYLDILWKKADFQSLILFTKKLRRFGPGMVDLPDAWEKAFFVVCMMAREFVGASEKFTETEIPKLVYTPFITRAQMIAAAVSKKGGATDEDIPVLVLMYEIQEIRRMNNGFGPTSFIDDSLNTVYLKFYQKKLENFTDEEISNYRFVGDEPQTNKLRVAKRDILNACANLLKCVDDQLKSHRLSEDVGLVMPNRMILPGNRGSITSKPVMSDGTSFIVSHPAPEPAPGVEESFAGADVTSIVIGIEAEEPLLEGKVSTDQVDVDVTIGVSDDTESPEPEGGIDGGDKQKGAGGDDNDTEDENMGNDSADITNTPTPVLAPDYDTVEDISPNKTLDLVSSPAPSARLADLAPEDMLANTTPDRHTVISLSSTPSTPERKIRLRSVSRSKSEDGEEEDPATPDQDMIMLDSTDDEFHTPASKQATT